MSRSFEAGLAGPRVVRWLALLFALASLGLAACGEDDEGESEAAADAAGATEEIVIQTEITFPRGGAPEGEVVDGSVIGDSPFCSGGTFSDSEGDASWLVEKAIECDDGTLRIGFSPGKPVDQTQAGPWKVLGGTGAYEGLEGGGRMEMKGEPGDPLHGRETFTGTVVP